jgi:hypothetical protein
MKTLKLFIALLIIFLLFFSGCIINIVGENPSFPVPEPSTLKLIAGALLAVYEVVVRVIPSVGDYSVVSWIIKFLKRVSDSLNNIKSG